MVFKYSSVKYAFYDKCYNVIDKYLGIMNARQQVVLAAMDIQTYRYLKERKIDYKNMVYAIPKLMHTLWAELSRMKRQYLRIHQSYINT